MECGKANEGGEERVGVEWSQALSRRHARALPQTASLLDADQTMHNDQPTKTLKAAVKHPTSHELLRQLTCL
jgi:hypothetical protein